MLKDVDVEKILVPSMVSSAEENYKYFMGYEDDDHKIKPLNIMLSKTSTYVKIYDGETKWTYFSIEADPLLEIIMIFEKTKTLVLKKN